MENKTNNNIDKKTEFAFSAIMFFAPLIKRNISTNKNLTQDEKSFIYGFVKLGYVNIVLLTIAIILGIVQLKTNNPLLQKISIAFLITLTVSLIIGTILAALNKDINIKNNIENIEKKTNFDKILDYIPIYNIYIWYKNHQFEGDNSTIKCSILLWTIFVLSSILIRNFYVNISILMFILFVVVCSINGITFGKKLTDILNKSFLKNPEEIWGYCSGIFLSFFNKDGVKENIDKQKQHFEFLFKIDNKQIIFEYILLLILCCTGLYVGINNGTRSLIIGNILIILRYGLMIIKWKHLPHLPIFKGISSIFFSSQITKNE